MEYFKIEKSTHGSTYWHVRHIPSGMMLLDNFHKRKDAQAALDLALSKNYPWESESPLPQAPDVEGSAFYRALKEIRGDYMGKFQSLGSF